jgi:hypothetical protein
MVRYIRRNGFVAVEDLDDLSDQSVVALNYNMNYVQFVFADLLAVVMVEAVDDYAMDSPMRAVYHQRTDP